MGVVMRKEKKKAEFICDFCEKKALKRADCIGRRDHDFCSKECYAKFLAAKPKQGETLSCPLCRTEFYRVPSQLKKWNRHFCSSRCHMIYQNEHDELHPNNPWTYPDIRSKKEWKGESDRKYYEKNKDVLRIKRTGWAREKEWKETLPLEYIEVAKLNYKLKRELKGENNENNTRI